MERERESGKLVLLARLNDDDDDDISSPSCHADYRDFPDSFSPSVSIILCSFRPVVGKFLLVSHHWQVYEKGSIRERHS